MLQNIDNFFFIFLFRPSGLTSCVCSYTTSKRIELESPTTSRIRDNFKGFPTVIYLLIFQYSQGKQCCKTLVTFFPFSFFATQDWLLVIVPPTYCAFRPRIGVTFSMYSVLFLSIYFLFLFLSFWSPPRPSQLALWPFQLAPHIW